MKFVLILIVATIFVATTRASPSDLKKQRLAAKACLKSCDNVEYKPICAGEGKDKPKSFGSVCVMENYNCDRNSHLAKVSDGECPGGGSIRLS